jgi:hypothetical protein
VFLETRHPDLIAVLATPKDADALRLIAEGTIGVVAIRMPRKACRTYAFLSYDCGALDVTAAKILSFGVFDLPKNTKTLVFYLRGAFWVPDQKKVCLLIAVAESAAHAIEISDSVAQAIRERLSDYSSAVGKWEIEEAAAKEKEEKDCEGRPKLDDILRRMRPVIGYHSRPRPPLPEMGDALEKLPRAVYAASDGRSRVREAIKESIIPAASEPEHRILYTRNPDKGYNAIVSWASPDPLPTFAEIRSALRGLVPSAFEKPLSESVNPPDQKITSNSGDTLDVEDEWPIRRISEAQIEEDEFNERAERGRRLVREQGFEAIAWYQSFHYYTEAYWGIYLHGERLADLACALGKDISARLHTRARAANALALELVLHHEWFHFMVDAYLALYEVEARAARYRRYKSKVYVPTLLSDECIEEALANWYSRREVANRLQAGTLNPAFGAPDAASGVLAVVDDWLDFSPAGYRMWRRGNSRETWRIFGAQTLWGLRAGAVASKLGPLETSILEPARLTLRPRHVPVRLVEAGPFRGVAPFAMNRRTAVALLRHFNHTVIPKRGKGSHEFWRGPNGQGFSLPRRDPLSSIVFHNLLGHLGLTKDQYLSQFHGAI